MLNCANFGLQVCLPLMHDQLATGGISHNAKAAVRAWLPSAGVCREKPAIGPHTTDRRSSTNECIPGLHSRTLPTSESCHARSSHGTAFACCVPLRVHKAAAGGGCPFCASVLVDAYKNGAT